MIQSSLNQNFSNGGNKMSEKKYETYESPEFKKNGNKVELSAAPAIPVAPAAPEVPAAPMAPMM
jgi:hypothetical protein